MNTLLRPALCLGMILFVLGSLYGFQGFGGYPLSFQLRQQLDVGGQPTSMVLGSFDSNDEFFDLAIAVGSRNLIYIYSGTASGNFAPHGVLRVSGFPQSIAAGDFNGDQVDDLAVVLNLSSDVRIFTSDGNGAFTTIEPFRAEFSPAHIAAGRFNDDALDDIAITHSVAGTVSIYRNGGNARFPESGRSFFLTGRRTEFVVAQDLDRDRRDDLVLIHNQASTRGVQPFFNNGNGNFRAGGSLTPIPRVSSVGAADFNRDGAMDLIASDDDPRYPGLVVHFGIGNGGTYWSPQRYHAASRIGLLASKDINADGKPDLITSSRYENKVRVFLGR